MGAAGDEGDVTSRLSERRAKPSTDAARAHDRYTHMTLPSKSTPAVQASIVGPPSIRKQ